MILYVQLNRNETYGSDNLLLNYFLYFPSLNYFEKFWVDFRRF